MIKKHWNKRAFIIYSIIGFMFGFFQLTGWKLSKEGNILWTGAYTARLLGACVLTGGLFGCGGSICFTGWKQRSADRWFSEEKTYKKDGYPGRICLYRVLSFVLLVICWLPCYLAYYPGICAYDTTIQMGQVTGGGYNDHHPIAHTLLLRGFTAMGEKLFGSVSEGVALFVLLQMLVLAGAVAWGICRLAENGVRKGVVLCIQLVSMFYPFHMYMSVSVCKDVLFSVFFLLQMLSLYEMIRSKAGFSYRDVLFLGASVGMQLFRNNGRYAMLVLLGVLVLTVLFGRTNRRFWGRITLVCLLALLAGSFCLSGLFRATGAQQGDRREMLSMPIQQLARCMIYHGGVSVLAEDDASMDEDAKALIQDFLLDEGYKEYRPDIADPVKRHTNTYVARYRAKDFIRTYLGLLWEYPGDYVNAVLAVNAGYLYVWDESHAYINVNGKDTGLGYVQTRFLTEELGSYGVYQSSKWQGLFECMEKWADTNAYLKNPVLKYIFVPGVFVWLYLLLAGALIVKKRYDRCVPLALVMGYYATLFLGPTVQLRYIYPLMLVLPFAAALSLTKDGERGESDSKENRNEDAE